MRPPKARRSPLRADLRNFFSVIPAKSRFGWADHGITGAECVDGVAWAPSGYGDVNLSTTEKPIEILDSESDEYKQKLYSRGIELWPSSEEEVDAHRMAAYATCKAVQFMVEQDLVAFNDNNSTPEQMQLFRSQVSAMQGWYHTALLLRHLHELDADLADELAAEMWLGADLGDGSIGEDTWEWSVADYDIPVPTDTLDERTVEECKAEILDRRERARLRRERKNAAFFQSAETSPAPK